MNRVLLTVRTTFFLGLFALSGLCIHGQEKEKPRVLFISSYSYSWETVPQQMLGISNALGPDVVLDSKFMDTKNIDTIEFKQIFEDYMSYYMNNVAPYNVVIAGDDAAFNFCLERKDTLFNNIPIVFEGVNNEQGAIEAAEDPMVTGVIESLSYKNTLNLAVSINPNAKEIVAILDDTVTGQGERRKFYSFRNSYPNHTLREINASSLTQRELVNAVRNLDSSSILIYIMCSEDKEGHMYASQEAVKMLSDAANIPMFSIVSIGLGKGLLGGEIVSQEMMGYEAGKMAYSIINGENPEKISLMKNTPVTYSFDESVIKRFGISRNLLPGESYIINHEETWLEKNETGVRNLFIIITAICMATIIPLILDNRRKTKKSDSIEKINQQLNRTIKYDSLTGILNRSMFEKDIEAIIKDGKDFAIMMYDLDNFKNINDFYGHSQGDQTLKDLSRRVHSLTDSFFTVYRLAGDEFMAIVKLKEREKIEKYANEVQNRLRMPFEIDGKQLSLHASIGIAMWPKDGVTATELQEAADAAMYHVKEHGKEGYAWFEDISSYEMLSEDKGESLQEIK